MTEEFELICMQMITNSDSAKSSYIEAIQKAKEGAFDEAERLMEEGDQFFSEAHGVHGNLLAQEASGEKVEFALILMHAEDQMASTEMARVMAGEIIALYRAK